MPVMCGNCIGDPRDCDCAHAWVDLWSWGSLVHACKIFVYKKLCDVILWGGGEVQLKPRMHFCEDMGLFLAQCFPPKSQAKICHCRFYGPTGERVLRWGRVCVGRGQARLH